MTREEAFEIWAPSIAAWSQWVKPVLFSHMRSTSFLAFDSEDIGWAPKADGSAAIVADLPGDKGVRLGLSLAAIGYRPVPLYNACPEASGEASLVEVRPILETLGNAAGILEGIKLADAAPPVFLLDANRGMQQFATAPGMLDNRSISLPTDFPSAIFLQSHGIRNILLVQQSIALPQPDLSHTLRRWQEAGLQIEQKELDRPDGPHPIVVDRPNRFRVLWYNLLTTVGLISSPLGGFGGHLPMPSSG